MSPAQGSAAKTTASRPRRNTRVGNTESFSSLLQAHRRAARASFRRMLITPFSSLMTCFVVAVSLLLPALLFGLNSNLSSLLAGFHDNAQITLYLQNNVNSSRGLEISDKLLTRTDISAASHISAAQALEEFAASAGLENFLEEITPNPLPGAIVITPADTSPQAVDSLALQLQEIPEVALVQVDSRWLQRLAAISRLVSIIGRGLSVIVVLGLFVIVGNTIKLAVENRKAEIRVIKLVGGSNMFAARPFLYSGLLYGLAGGVLAILLQALVLTVLNSSFMELMQLYQSKFQLRGFGLFKTLILVFAGCAVGWAAALAASLRHIRHLDHCASRTLAQ